MTNNITTAAVQRTTLETVTMYVTRRQHQAACKENAALDWTLTQCESAVGSSKNEPNKTESTEGELDWEQYQSVAKPRNSKQ